MQVMIDRENPAGNDYFEMMKVDKRYKMGRRVGLVVWLQIMQQLVGIGVVTVYAPTGQSRFRFAADFGCASQSLVSLSERAPAGLCVFHDD